LELATGAWGRVRLFDTYGFENVRNLQITAGLDARVVALQRVAGGGYRVSDMTLEGQGDGEFESRIERRGLPVMGAPSKAMTTEMWLEVDGGSSFDVSALASETMTGQLIVDGPHAINSATQVSAHPRVTGRYCGYRITTNSRTGWAIQSLWMRQEPAGER
jgi:hypothetical protein